jgi:predicted membrane protein
MIMFWLINLLFWQIFLLYLLHYRKDEIKDLNDIYLLYRISLFFILYIWYLFEIRIYYLNSKEYKQKEYKKNEIRKENKKKIFNYLTTKI